MMKIKFYSGNSALHDNWATAPLNPPQFSILSFSAGWICFSHRFWDVAKFHRQSFSGAILHLTNRASAGSLTLTERIPPTDLKEWVTQKIQPIIKQCSFFPSEQTAHVTGAKLGKSSLRSNVFLFGKLHMLLSWHHSSHSWLSHNEAKPLSAGLAQLSTWDFPSIFPRLNL